MKHGVLLLGMVLLLAGTSLWRADVQLSYFRVEKEGDFFAITWKAQQQEGVEAYVLLRKTPYSGGTYKQIEKVPATNRVEQEYLYVDRELYKAASEKVDYHLEVVFDTGHRELVASESMEYQPTAVRRTWGSIKAMFQ